MRAFVTSLALGAMVVLSAPCALAQPASGTSDAVARAAAQEHMTKGLALYAQAEKTKDPALYEATYLEYLQAFTVYPRSEKGLWNLCIIEVDTRRYVDALKHLRDYDQRTSARATNAHAKHEWFGKLWDSAFKETGHIAVQAPTGALIVVDGKGQVGVAPLADPIDVVPGKHSVEAAIGEKKSRAEVDARAGAAVPAVLSDPTAVSEPAHPTPLPPRASRFPRRPAVSSPARRRRRGAWS